MSEAKKTDFEARLGEVCLEPCASFAKRVRESMQEALAANVCPVEPAKREAEGDIASRRTPRIAPVPRRLTRAAGVAVAAGVVFVFMTLWLTSGPKPQMSAYGELTEAFRKSQAAEWAHLTTKMSGPPDWAYEAWVATGQQRLGWRRGDDLTYRIGATVYSYHAASDTITVDAAGNPEGIDDFAHTYFLQGLDRLEELRNKGVTVTKTAVTLEDRTYDVYSYDSEREYARFSITVDPSTWRVIRIEKDGLRKMSAGFRTLTIVDYPSTGPEDIYALGAPRGAKVVEGVGAESRSLSERIMAARDAFAPNYFAAIVSITESQPQREYPPDSALVLIVRRKGDRYRIDQYVTLDTANMKVLAMGATTGPLEVWAASRKPLLVHFGDAGDNKEESVHRRSVYFALDPDIDAVTKHPYSTAWVAKTVEWMTWVWMAPVSDPEMNLPRMDTTYGTLEGFQHISSGAMEGRKDLRRRGVYVNPERDYIAEESFVLLYPEEAQVAADRAFPQDELVSPQSPYDEVEIRKVVEYGQTPAGQWYVKKSVTEKSTNESFAEHMAHGNSDMAAWLAGKTRTTTTILLDTSREIPDDLFDAAKFEAEYTAPVE